MHQRQAPIAEVPDEHGAFLVVGSAVSSRIVRWVHETCRTNRICDQEYRSPSLRSSRIQTAQRGGASPPQCSLMSPEIPALPGGYRGREPSGRIRSSKTAMRPSFLILRRWLAVTGACLAITACAHSVSPEVSRRQTQWQSKRIRNYDFVYYRQSMVGRCTVLVHVRNGKVVSAAVQRRCPWPLNPYAAPTIDALFSTTRTAYRNNDSVVSNFDLTYGFPTDISVDPNKHVTDDEWDFGVSSFTPR
jgi:hypothetical protein